MPRVPSKPGVSLRSAAKRARSRKPSIPTDPAAATQPSINPVTAAIDDSALALFHPLTAAWFRAVFDAPTAPQREGWPAIARGDSTLILAPTGTGKTLTAFLWCIDRLMMQTPPSAPHRCRVVYISPLKALAVDVERNLRSPLQGIANMAAREGIPFRMPRSASAPATPRPRIALASAAIQATSSSPRPNPFTYFSPPKQANPSAPSRPSSSTRSTRSSPPSAARTWPSPSSV